MQEMALSRSTERRCLKTIANIKQAYELTQYERVNVTIWNGWINKWTNQETNEKCNQLIPKFALNLSDLKNFVTRELQAPAKCSIIIQPKLGWECLWVGISEGRYINSLNEWMNERTNIIVSQGVWIWREAHNSWGSTGKALISRAQSYPQDSKTWAWFNRGQHRTKISRERQTKDVCVCVSGIKTQANRRLVMDQVEPEENRW